MALSFPFFSSPAAAPLPSPATSSTPPPSNGARLVTADGRSLPLRGASLRADARGGIARVVLEQRFANPYGEPLAVTYQMPLPADAAVSGYAFTVGTTRIVGEVDRKHQARERFEQAISRGHTAALLEQDRSSLFTQEIGNIPPGAELIAEISLDQRLVFLADGAWEWRFPTVVAPRYLGEAGRVRDAARVAVTVLDRGAASGVPGAGADDGGGGAPRVSLSLSIGDAIATGKQPESPSHPLACQLQAVEGGAGALVSLREAGDGGAARLDRDVVVRWPVATPSVGLSLQTARPGPSRRNTGSAYGLLTIVPPTPEARSKAVPRDLIVLIDSSGSMGGRPLEQAARVISAMIDTLSPDDQLELIEFNSQPRRWKRGPVLASPEARRDAIRWVKAIRAGGGTEMRTGILEALAPLRAGSQRQIVLVTDGLIGFEREIVETICERLPLGSRVHTVGVGSGVNRSLTAPAARAGRGVEVVIALDEDPERAAQRVVERTFAPLVTDVVIEGDALVASAPAAMPDLFAGAPVLASLQLRPDGGALTVRGLTAHGPWSQSVEVPPTAVSAGNQSVVALFGRESVEDLETRWAMGSETPRIDAEIERIGLAFQLATRLTSWVAISHELTVDRSRGSRHEDIPQETPHGMSLDGLGLRPALEAQAQAQDKSIDGKPGDVLFSLRELISTEDGRIAQETPAARLKDFEEKDEEEEETEQAEEPAERSGSRAIDLLRPEKLAGRAVAEERKQEAPRAKVSLIGKLGKKSDQPSRRASSTAAPAPLPPLSAAPQGYAAPQEQSPEAPMFAGSVSPPMMAPPASQGDSGPPTAPHMMPPSAPKRGWPSLMPLIALILLIAALVLGYLALGHLPGAARGELRMVPMGNTALASLPPQAAPSPAGRL
jgi:Ca-activated chloride channel homolog